MPSSSTVILKGLKILLKNLRDKNLTSCILSLRYFHDNIGTLMNINRLFHEFLVSDSICEAVRYGWRYDSRNGFWIKNNVKFRHMRKSILEVFEWHHYNTLDVKDKVVIDVGAFIGDSAIYFALRGASKVIAIEPHLGAYAEMLDNIRLNNLKNRIIAILTGLSSISGKICVHEFDINAAWGTHYRVGNCRSFIPAITLGDIINKYNITDNAVLKMDCEGCEYDVVLNTKPEELKVFDQIIIEYHNGYMELLNTLKSLGYNIFIKPISGSQQPIEKQGFIIAKRKIVR
jgi:FkbM family methyltransferase